jgi:hypothetical protein
MSSLPDLVTQYLERTGVSAARLVYVFLDRQGKVTSWGGDVELLAPRHLEVGKLATEQLPGLVGLVPVGDAPVVIPNLQIEPGLIVHLHTFPAPASCGVVLLLDAAPGYEEKRRKQQRGYDEKLAARAKRPSKRQ